LKEICGCNQNASYGPPKPGETRQIFLNTAKAQMGLGWIPTVNIQDGLRITVDYIKRSSESVDAKTVNYQDLEHIQR
jgi:nucleoside-diphosphate-sugar epimerase